jgi:L-ribulose-5-phosphate 4-epimerase
LYIGFESIGGIVHTHSTYATAFTQAGRPIPCFGTTHADFFNGEVLLTRKMRAVEIASAYEWETGAVILERLRGLNPAEYPAVLVNRHAPFTWGPTVSAAVETAIALELCARLALLSLQIDSDLGKIESELLEKHFHRKHGPDAYYGQSKADESLPSATRPS